MKKGSAGRGETLPGWAGSLVRGRWLLLAAAVVFVILWGDVLVGRRTLIAGDLLYGFFPWVKAQGAHASHNPLLGDPVTFTLPMLTFARAAVFGGHLPLWNPHTMAGAPQFANDQSAFWWPFNLVTLVFAPARGLSLAMLAKLVTAAAAMYVLVRRLGAGGYGAAAAAIAYATSSYVVVWLGFTTGSVAAVAPLVYAAADWLIASGARRAFAATAAAVALGVLAGHAETLFQVMVGVGIFSLVRALPLGRPAGVRLVQLAGACGLGAVTAGVQDIPFIVQAAHVGVASSRSASHIGLVHLPLEKLRTWFAPSLRGNPSIDGFLEVPWNFNEATGFIGVGALCLAGVGAWRGLRRRDNRTVALVVTAAAALAIVYGALTPVVGRLPVLSSTLNTRFLLTACLCLVALGGLGMDRLVRDTPGGPRGLGWLVAPGVVAVGVTVALGAVLFVRRSRVDALLGNVHGVIVFWALLAAASAVAAVCLVAATSAAPTHGLALLGLGALLLVEGAVFAAPYNPHEPAAEVLPQSKVVSWLQRRAPARVSAYSDILLPNTAGVYGFDDVRGREVLIDPRYRAYWTAADPHYDDSYYYTFVTKPDPRYLAAAGVDYFLTTTDFTLPRTTLQYSAEGVNVARVDGARPFAFFAPAPRFVAGEPAALTALRQAPDGPVVVEAASAAAPVGATSDITPVRVVQHDAQQLRVDVDAPSAGVLVLLQAYSADWKASVDGRDAPVEPADVMFQAIPVAAGRHEVTVRYAPTSLLAGAIASALGLAVILALTLWPRRSARLRSE